MHPIDDIKADMVEVKSTLKEISETLSENTTSLKIHEARTSLAEKRLEHVESSFRWFAGLILAGIISAVAHLFSK